MLTFGITLLIVPAAWAVFILAAAVIESHDRRHGGAL
jgi:hypothetical protein